MLLAFDAKLIAQQSSVNYTFFEIFLWQRGKDTRRQDVRHYAEEEHRRGEHSDCGSLHEIGCQLIERLCSGKRGLVHENRF